MGEPKALEQLLEFNVKGVIYPNEFKKIQNSLESWFPSSCLGTTMSAKLLLVLIIYAISVG
jgi:hypothetical protein